MGGKGNFVRGFIEQFFACAPSINNDASETRRTESYDTIDAKIECDSPGRSGIEKRRIDVVTGARLLGSLPDRGGGAPAVPQIDLSRAGAIRLKDDDVPRPADRRTSLVARGIDVGGQRNERFQLQIVEIEVVSAGASGAIRREAEVMTVRRQRRLDVVPRRDQIGQ